MVVIQVIGCVFLILGSVICLIGGIGLLRMPNFFARAHAASVPDTLGAGFALMGMMLIIAGYEHHLYTWDLKALVFLKLLFIGIFLFFTGPIAGHAVCKAAFERGLGSDLANPAELGSEGEGHD